MEGGPKGPVGLFAVLFCFVLFCRGAGGIKPTHEPKLWESPYWLRAAGREQRGKWLPLKPKKKAYTQRGASTWFIFSHK